MIYVASIYPPAKKALGDKCHQTTVMNIIEQLKIDPAISGMDACLLGPRDVVGIHKIKLEAALATKHPKICVIYLYTKDKDSEGVNTDSKRQVKKITPEVLPEIVNNFINIHAISQGQTVVSRDSKVSTPISSTSPVGFGATKGNIVQPSSAPKPEPDIVDDVQEEYVPEVVIEFDESLGLYYYLDINGDKIYCSVEGVPLSENVLLSHKKRVELKKTEEVTTTNESSLHEETTEQSSKSELTRNIESIRDFHDWDLLREQLRKDNVIRNLLEENSTYQGVSQMLSVLNEEVLAIHQDTSLPSDVKFEKIANVGRERSKYIEKHNDMVSRKAIELMNTVTRAATNTVDDLMLSHKKSLGQIETTKVDVYEEELLDIVQEKAEAEFELLAAIKAIIELYQSMDSMVDSIILELNSKIPSDNDFVNSMFNSLGEVITPQNSSELAKLLMTTLHDNRMTMSLLENSVQGVVQGIHHLLHTYRLEIEHQDMIIKMLRANRIEDIVVLDSLVKGVLRVYVGKPRTGLTATALTWSGCQSRQRNTLLIDMTASTTLENYGVEPHSLRDLITERIEEPLCVVRGEITDEEDLAELMRELKTRLSYYAYINIIVDASETEAIETLANDALSVSYVTDCTIPSMKLIGDSLKSLTVKNVARKVIYVDPPVVVRKLAETMNIDITNTKCITVPHIPKIKMCALTASKPYEYREVRTIFEEAFK